MMMKGRKKKKKKEENEKIGLELRFIYECGEVEKEGILGILNVKFIKKIYICGCIKGFGLCN